MINHWSQAIPIHKPSMIRSFKLKLTKLRWQDWVFSTGSIIFDITLWGILLNPMSKVSMWSSIVTAAVLYVFSWTQWTMGLRVTPCLTLITATEWALVAIIRS